MALVSKRADLLERGLQGFSGTDQEVRGLIETASQIPALTSAACSPRAEFVAALGLRLRAEALTLPARQGRPTPPTTRAHRSATRPRVLVIRTRLPRVLAGATASLVLIGALVGVSSRSALPDGLLYPVKEVLNSAAVRLAGSDLDRGVTLLSQAREHVSDARSLVGRDGRRADASPVSQALRSAYEAAGTGQRALLGDFDRNRDTAALLAVQEFASDALPQLNTLRPLVPAASQPDVDALVTLLHQAQTTIARRVEVCGQPCASLGATMPTGPPSLATPTRAPSVPTAVASLTPSRPAQSLKPVQRRRPVSRPTVVIPRRIPVPVVGPVPLPSIRATVIATTPAVTIGPLTVKSARIVVPPVPLLIHPPVAISPVAIPPVAIPPVAVPPVAVPPVTGIPKLP